MMDEAELLVELGKLSKGHRAAFAAARADALLPTYAAFAVWEQ